MTNQPYSRWLLSEVLNSLQIRRVILLQGPRQCGKSTLAKHLNVDMIYKTLDDVILLQSAYDDPHGFIKHDKPLMIIDEIQRAPNLLLAIKKEVDEVDVMGRFLLTGSANIQTLPTVRESLAGRVRKVRLRPLAIGEIQGKNPDFIESIFAGKLQHYQATLHKTQYLELAFKGGYPEAIKCRTLHNTQTWHNDYIEAIIDRDLHDISNIKRSDALHQLVGILAAWSSKFMDISKITSHLSIDRSTVESYINALESLYIVERVRPWTHTDYARVGRQDKLFLTDSGLMASLLKWKFDEVQDDGAKNGKLLETFVFTQLAATIDASKEHFELYHYRDRDKREIDFIIQDRSGNIVAIEVKAGSAVDKKSFKHIEWFRKNMMKGQKFTGIVLYTGEHIAPFGEGLWAVPIERIFGSHI